MGKLVGWLGTDLVEHALEPDRSLLVGRGPSCSLSLAVATRAVSREHFRVVPLPGGRHQLVDLSSTNGTFVNGARVATALLEHGDVVRLGDVELLFLPVREDARLPVAPRAAEGKSDPVGALVLLAAHGLDALPDADQQLLEAVAAQTAGLVRRACLYRQATVDHLTGLSTRASTERALLKELRRGGVSRPLSVLLLDLDHFKAINDVHGHQVGDQVLREVARRTRAALPATVVGRWGGEELLVVLPGAGPAEARRVVALLAQAVRSSPIGAARVPVTASFGVATFPEDGDSLDLVRSAERALEAVKASRRDQRAHDQAARGRRPVAAR